MNFQQYILRAAALVGVILCPILLWSQFYNGSQNIFGKNRMQYKDFYWQFYRYPLFDVYFSVNGKELAQYTALKATEEVKSIGLEFNAIYKRRIVFVVYNTIGDFKQTNIGQSIADQSYNIGGTTNIIDNKVILYFDGNHARFDRLLREKIAQLYINELLYGGDSYKDILTRSATSEYPKWFTEGLVSYRSCEWDANIESQLRNLLQSNNFKNINRLEQEDAVVMGHALWKYIADLYGADIINNIFYLTSITRNVNQAFMYGIGVPIKPVFDSCMTWYKLQLVNDGVNIDSALNVERIKQSLCQGVMPNSTRIAPDGNRTVYCSNDRGRYSVWLLDLATGKRKRLIRREHRLLQVNDLGMPQFAWHPTGKLFAMSWEGKGKQWLSLYDVENKKWFNRQIHAYEKVLYINYSPDGYQLVVSAINNGQSDLFLFDLASNTSEAITNDLADDLQPRFSIDGKEILYASNKMSDSSNSLAKNLDLWKIPLANKQKSQKLTSTTNENEQQPQEIESKRYLFLSDRTGTANQYLLKPDSSISFIDTTIHYRFFSQNATVSKWKEAVYEFDYLANNKNKMLFWMYRKSKYSLFIQSGKLLTNKELLPVSNIIQRYRQKLEADSLWQCAVKDSTNAKKRRWLETVKKDSAININEYVFDFEKDSSLLSDTLFFPIETKKEILPKVYQKAFYINKIVNQVDFGFLNESYQAFTGGEVYSSPGLNVFLKLGVIDLFEDYRLTGGVRVSSNLENNEYLVSIENMKRRLDKKLIFHRQTIEYTDNTNYYKENQHELREVLRWPFSPVTALQFSNGGRYDRMTTLAIDNKSLDAPTAYKWWFQSKLEYIFDNTIPKGLNLYNGWRLKVFGEYYQQIWNERQSIFIVGTDIRTYQRIHRNIIWANRFSYSTSTGTGELLYYLGSVDSWMNVFSGYPTYNSDIAYDRNKKWMYQTLAVNMRGFNQNIRNGNSFAVFNSELRVPIISYLANRPIQSDALKNFQIIGFTDIGAAWNGFIPTNNNEYRYKTYNNGPVTVIVDKYRQAIVWGYGLGVRTRILGYFIRADWARGVENNIKQANIFYLSLSLDF